MTWKQFDSVGYRNLDNYLLQISFFLSFLSLPISYMKRLRIRFWESDMSCLQRVKLKFKYNFKNCALDLCAIEEGQVQDPYLKRPLP